MTQTKGELRKIALLDAAEHVLVTSGNANATMRNFAAASNVRIGHLQHYLLPARIVASMMQQQNDPTTVRLYVEIWAMAASDAEIATVLRDFYAHYAAYVEVIVNGAQPGLEAGARQAKANSVVALFEGQPS